MSRESEKLYRGITYIDDELIENAEILPHKKRSTHMKWIAVAASLCICVAGAYAIHLTIGDSAHDDIEMEDNIQESEALDSEEITAEDMSAAEDTLPADEESSDSETFSQEALQEDIAELQQNDAIGWIVIGNKLYVQSGSEEAELESAITARMDAYMGRASEFTGYYQGEDAIDGDVYTVVDQPELICIKLDNGATVLLQEKEGGNGG